jgi:hypothetical protein
MASVFKAITRAGEVVGCRFHGGGEATWAALHLDSILAREGDAWRCQSGRWRHGSGLLTVGGRRGERAELGQKLVGQVRLGQIGVRKEKKEQAAK